MDPKFAAIPARAIRDRSLGNAALRVLCCLGLYAGKDGWCRPSTRTLADQLGLSRQAAVQHLRTLAGLGYVEIGRRTRPDGGDAANEYRVIFAAGPPAGNLDTGGQGELAPRASLELAPPASSELAPISKNTPIEHTLSRQRRERGDGLTPQKDLGSELWAAYHTREAVDLALIALGQQEIPARAAVLVTLLPPARESWVELSAEIARTIIALNRLVEQRDGIRTDLLQWGMPAFPLAFDPRGNIPAREAMRRFTEGAVREGIISAKEIKNGS